jgi:tetrahydromethanopterin S-methyltransferase subunit H
MRQLQSEQKEFAIGKVMIGGMPGKNPTVLVGSIFYHKQRSLSFKEQTGEFKRNEAERLIKISEEFSDKTGLPCMLDVVLPSKRWVGRVLDFITSVTDMPILLDSGSAETRVAALEYVNQSGIKDKCVYNSLSPQSKAFEFEKIRETGLKAAVLLAYNIKNLTWTGRVQAAEQLLPLAIQSGVEKALIDACVLDVPTLGSAFKAISFLKNSLGYPTGCGAHNAIGTWKGLKTKMGRQAIKSCAAVASALTITAGADYVLYGPIEHAPYMFPAVAMVDAAFAQLLIENGKTPSPSHPIFKIA